MDNTPALVADPGEDYTNLIPVRPALNRGFGLLQQNAFNTRASQNARPSTAAQAYAAELSSRAQPEIPLPGGFSIPLGFVGAHAAVNLPVGGTRPGLAEQMEAMYYGQRTDHGFNLFGFNVALPEWAGGLVRTHASAELVFRYRNIPSERWYVGPVLDAIHPGYPSRVLSETAPESVVLPSGLDSRRQPTLGSSPSFKFRRRKLRRAYD